MRGRTCLAGIGLVMVVAAPSLLAAQGSPSPVTVERLLGAFSELPGLHARFVEEKRLAMLAVPLETRGEIFFAPPDRLLRRVTAPNGSEARVAGDRLVLEGEDGREVIDLSDNREVGAFVQTFRNVLAGDLDALSRDYRITLQGDERAWQLRLDPRGDTLRRFLTHLTLEGDGVVLRRMTMLEPNGDETRTTFSEIDAERRFSARELSRLFP